MNNIHCRASMILWMLDIKLRDLEAHANGDINRFEHMVCPRGKSLGNPSRWVEDIQRMANEPLLADYFPEELAACRDRAESVGVELP